MTSAKPRKPKRIAVGEVLNFWSFLESLVKQEFQIQLIWKFPSFQTDRNQEFHLSIKCDVRSGVVCIKGRVHGSRQ